MALCFGNENLEGFWGGLVKSLLIEDIFSSFFAFFGGVVLLRLQIVVDFTDGHFCVVLAARISLVRLLRV